MVPDVQQVLQSKDRLEMQSLKRSALVVHPIIEYHIHHRSHLTRSLGLLGRENYMGIELVSTFPVISIS